MNKRYGIIFALAACAQVETAPSQPPASQDTCNANTYGYLINSDATDLERVLILGRVRLIRPGEAVTQDFVPTRINFLIDANETISAITCG